jgi:hypothetical protein
LLLVHEVLLLEINDRVSIIVQPAISDNHRMQD